MVIVMPMNVILRQAVVLVAAVVLSDARLPADDATKPGGLRLPALPPELDDDVGFIGPPPRVPPTSISDSGFNHLAFGAGSEVTIARLRFAELVDQRIAAIDRCCALTANQRQKLLLACRGDVHRFFDRVEELRPAMHSMQNAPVKNRKELTEWVLHQLKGDSFPFDARSLLTKTLRNTLSREQAARFETMKLMPTPTRQQIAIQRIEKLGGRVPKRGGGPGWLRTQIGDEWMGAFDEVERVDLRRTQINDADLAVLQNMASVPTLYLAETPVTDTGLAHLQGLTTIRNLVLDETSITDAGLVHLQGLTGLQFLSLYSTRVTDAGLIHLQDLNCLRELYLSGPRVTDAGLAELKRLPKLRMLSLYDTQVTDAALAELQRESPNLQVQELKPR